MRCRKCNHCNTNKINAICGKLTAQALICADVWAATLTLDDSRGEKPYNAAREYDASLVTGMMKALRQDASRNNGGVITHWFQAERGEKKGRWHWHGFIFFHALTVADGVLENGDLVRAAHLNRAPGWMPPHHRNFIREKEDLKASLANPKILNLRCGQGPIALRGKTASGMNGYQQEWRYWPWGRITVESLMFPQGVAIAESGNGLRGDPYSAFRYAAKYASGIDKGANNDKNANAPPGPWANSEPKAAVEKNPPTIQSNRSLFGVSYARAQAHVLADGGFAVNSATFGMLGQYKRQSHKRKKQAMERVADGRLTRPHDWRGERRQYEFSGKLRQRFVEFYAVRWMKRKLPEEFQARRATCEEPVPSEKLRGEQRDAWLYWRRHDLDVATACRIWFDRYRAGQQSWPHSDIMSRWLAVFWDREQEREDYEEWCESMIDDPEADTGLGVDAHLEHGDVVQVGSERWIYLHADGSAYYRRNVGGKTGYWRAIQTQCEWEAARAGRLPRVGATATEIEVYGGPDPGTPRLIDNAAIRAHFEARGIAGVDQDGQPSSQDRMPTPKP